MSRGGGRGIRGDRGGREKHCEIKEQRGKAEGLRETETKRCRDKRCSEIEEERE